MRLIFSLFCIVVLSGCSKSSRDDENCRFLLDVKVNITINLSLPQYSQLPFAGNSAYIPNAGNSGIIVASTGFEFYAWDAADPNLPPSSCSTLVPSGLNASSECEDKNTYSLVTGEPLNNGDLRCSLRFYRVEQNGDNLIIFN